MEIAYLVVILVSFGVASTMLSICLVVAKLAEPDITLLKFLESGVMIFFGLSVGIIVIGIATAYYYRDADATLLEKSRFLKCILAEKNSDHYRFVVLGGTEERFFKVPLSDIDVREDRFFRRKGLEITIKHRKRHFVYYR